MSRRIAGLSEWFAVNAVRASALIAATGLLGAFVLQACGWIPCLKEPSVQVYREYRAAFFSAGLSLAALLFAMKTWIVLELKTHVYDSADLRRWAERQAATFGDGTPSEDRYAPLERVAGVLRRTIWVSIGASAFHATIGLFSFWPIAWLGFAVTLCSVLMMCAAAIMLRVAVDDLIEGARRVAKERARDERPPSS